jgi:hypothetical protein
LETDGKQGRLAACLISHSELQVLVFTLQLLLSSFQMYTVTGQIMKPLHAIAEMEAEDMLLQLPPGVACELWNYVRKAEDRRNFWASSLKTQELFAPAVASLQYTLDDPALQNDPFKRLHPKVQLKALTVQSYRQLPDEDIHRSHGAPPWVGPPWVEQEDLRGAFGKFLEHASQTTITASLEKLFLKVDTTIDVTIFSFCTAMLSTTAEASTLRSLACFLISLVCLFCFLCIAGLSCDSLGHAGADSYSAAPQRIQDGMVYSGCWCCTDGSVSLHTAAAPHPAVYHTGGPV